MKTLVAYYSAQGHTRRVAEIVASNLSADLFEVVPADPYTEEDFDWTNENSRCSREHDNPSLRDMDLVISTVPNWDEYNRIIIGYPIWWGIAAWPVDAFVKKQNFTGKIVVPFCTSHSSGIGDSDLKLKAKAKNGEWRDGRRFFQDVTSAIVKSWADNLK